jgi:hypothetical protein
MISPARTKTGIKPRTIEYYLDDIRLVKDNPTGHETDYITIAKLVQLRRFREERDRRGTNPRVSTTLYCIRQEVFRALDPHQELQDEEMFYFSRGIGVHKYLQELWGDYDKKRFLIEQDYDYQGIPAHPDVIDLLAGRILELKTTEQLEKDMRKKDQAWDSNIEQLTRYMAISGILKGTIIYMHCWTDKELKKRNREIEKQNEKMGGPYLEKEVQIRYSYHHYTLDPADRQKILDKLVNKTGQYNYALSEKDPLLAPGVRRDWSKRFKCDDCPWKYKLPCLIHEGELPNSV